MSNKDGIRIIGGKLRRRIINVPDVPGLRPSTDRVRETLFNWLAPVISDSVCLDLCCGSGILGLEALSRGAKFVRFVDHNPQVIEHVQNALENFALSNADILCWQLPTTQYCSEKRFDIVFLDPPFNKGLLKVIGHWLEKSHLLNTPAWVYVESEAQLDLSDLPANWQPYRLKQTKKTQYALYQRQEVL